MTPVEREKKKIAQLERIEKKLDTIIGALDDAVVEIKESVKPKTKAKK